MFSRGKTRFRWVQFNCAHVHADFRFDRLPIVVRRSVDRTMISKSNCVEKYCVPFKEIFERYIYRVFLVSRSRYRYLRCEWSWEESKGINNFNNIFNFLSITLALNLFLRWYLMKYPTLVQIKIWLCKIYLLLFIDYMIPVLITIKNNSPTLTLALILIECLINTYS